MIHIIIATHGKMAAAALELCEMLTGKKDHVATLSFCPGDSLDMLLESYTDAFNAFGPEAPVLIFTDIQGGSPCNVAMALCASHANARVISGFSVPMLLHAFEVRADAESLDELVQETIRVGKFAMKEVVLN